MSLFASHLQLQHLMVQTWNLIDPPLSLLAFSPTGLRSRAHRKAQCGVTSHRSPQHPDSKALDAQVPFLLRPPCSAEGEWEGREDAGGCGPLWPLGLLFAVCEVIRHIHSEQEETQTQEWTAQRSLHPFQLLG